MRRITPKKQFNIRLPLKTIDLVNAAAEQLELAQVDVVREAIEMYARRKRVTLETSEVK